VLASLEREGVVRAASREELVICALKARLSEMGAAGAELARLLGEWRAPAAARKAPAGPSSAGAGATEQLSMTDLAARLDELSAFAQALVSRVDRIGAISEQALLAVANLNHRIAAGAPANTPRQFGLLRWSLRQPRKALRGVLNRLRTFLKPLVEPRKRAASAAIAPSNKSTARI
jgi:hypothetical protein